MFSNFMFCYFMPCKLVCHFHTLHFYAMSLDPSSSRPAIFMVCHSDRFCNIYNWIGFFLSNRQICRYFKAGFI